MSRISKYIIFVSSFFCLFCSNASAQNTEELPEIELYQGLKVELDLFSLVMSGISNGETFSVEGNVQINLKEKFFPILEAGFGRADKISRNGYGFKTNGIFARIGMDYNLLKPNDSETKIHRYFFVGARYGFSPFVYDITNIQIKDDYWNKEEIRDFMDVKTTKHWVEVVAGLRVEVFNNIYMGWNARLKVQLGKEKEGEVSPWYIPGVGIKSTGSNWAFNYAVGYRF